MTINQHEKNIIYMARPPPSLPPCDRHVHLPRDTIIVSGDELVNFRHDLDPPDEVDVVVHALPVLPVGEVVVEALGGDRGHAFSHENLAHGFVQNHLISGKRWKLLLRAKFIADQVANKLYFQVCEDLRNMWDIFRPLSPGATDPFFPRGEQLTTW